MTRENGQRYTNVWTISRIIKFGDRVCRIKLADPRIELLIADRFQI